MTFKFFTLFEVMPFVKSLAMNRKKFSLHYEEEFNYDLDCMVTIYVVVIHSNLA